MWINPARGYIGLLGVVLTAIGMVLPYDKLWLIEASFIDSLNSWNGLVCAGFILLLVASGLCFFIPGGYRIANWLSVILLVGTLLRTLLDHDGMPTGDLFRYLQYGFWIMLIGEVMMAISTPMMEINEKISTLFKPSDYKTIENSRERTVDPEKKYWESIIMTISGAVSMLVGVIILIIGINQNNSLRAQLARDFNDFIGETSINGSPGTIWIVVGIILLIFGMVLLAYGLKNRRNINSH